MTAPANLRSPVVADDGTVVRRVTITPHMCGGSSSIFAQLGDWTWEAVTAACGANVYDARTPDGHPAYLSFYYYHVSGSDRRHPHGLTFGDELTVTSRVFDFGSESVLTLHRLAPATVSEELFDPDEFFENRRSDSLYVQNFNRWVARSRSDSNAGLMRCSPPDFSCDRVPRLPDRYSPRAIAARARKNASFHPEGVVGYVRAESFSMPYDLDLVHDFNGVGLVYFASYFSIVDTALLRLWRQLGRDDRRFLGRKVLDQKLGYFGNADAGERLWLSVHLWRRKERAGDEIAEVCVREERTGRLLAVSSIHLLSEEQ